MTKLDRTWKKKYMFDGYKWILLFVAIATMIWIYAGFGFYHRHIETHKSPAMGELFSSKGAGANSSLKTQLPAPIYKVTAYCPLECCCGRYADGTTASGHKAIGKIVAAPRSIPYGTIISIPGYGQGIVRDRGGAIKGNRLDVLFTDKDGVSGHQRALNWGVQYLEVTFMEME